MINQKLCQLRTQGRAVLSHAKGFAATETIQTPSGKIVAVCSNCAAYQRARAVLRAHPGMRGDSDIAVLALATVLQGLSLDSLAEIRRAHAWHHARRWVAAGYLQALKAGRFALTEVKANVAA